MLRLASPAPKRSADESGRPLRFGVRSIGVAFRGPRLERFLQGRYQFEFLPPGVAPHKGIDGLAGWGIKGAAMAEAARRGLPYLALEDGFLSTAGMGGRGDPNLSLSADRLGMHYDATRPSEIEQLIQGAPPLTPHEAAEVERLIALMQDANLGKYNAAADLADDDPVLADGPLVIVVDQIRGDKSVVAGGCGPETFARMLDAAVAENPGAKVIARVHPVEGRGSRRGHLRPLAKARGIEIFDRSVSWMSLVKHARRVYVATSLAGLEGLIAGRPVTCFGLPIYAGWGLTDDRLACPRRTARPALESLIAAIYLRYLRYLSPLDGEPCSGLDVARLLAARRRRDAETEGLTHVLGVHRWKDFHVEPFLKGRRSRLTYSMDADVALQRQREQGGRIAVWASREPDDLAARCAAQGAALVRVEDGFIRSVGLGANLSPPSSLVLDHGGIYYDPGRQSDLERILQTAEFPPEALQQAAGLRALIVKAGLSKYNVGAPEVAALFAGAGDRRRILVPGQVANDASVVRGGGRIQGNLQLLQAARAARPGAFIVYKTHPDVEAGLRPGAIPAAEALKYADVIAYKTSIASLLDQAHEVHTLTSLSGFEALMRGLVVVSYGLPFYAGWGLTEDRERCVRRGRRLKLDELVAGALIVYPRYVHRPSLAPCDAADVARQLSFSLLAADPVGLLRRRRTNVLLRHWFGRHYGG
ncbi:MAG TPA: capsular polysaccharide biosynthesis protein [Caulobacteraceae bacterium]